jgi:hypothetical protein
MTRVARWAGGTGGDRAATAGSGRNADSDSYADSGSYADSDVMRWRSRRKRARCVQALACCIEVTRRRAAAGRRQIDASFTPRRVPGVQEPWWCRPVDTSPPAIAIRCKRDAPETTAARNSHRAACHWPRDSSCRSPNLLAGMQGESRSGGNYPQSGSSLYNALYYSVCSRLACLGQRPRCRPN